MYENFELKVFKNIKFVDEISNNWPNNLLVANVYKTFSWIMLTIIVHNITLD